MHVALRILILGTRGGTWVVVVVLGVVIGLVLGVVLRMVLGVVLRLVLGMVLGVVQRVYEGWY